MNRFVFLFIAVFSSAFLLSGCESTTQGGATGATRSQFLLISSKQVNEAAAMAYTKELNKARAQKSLNTNEKETKRVNEITSRLIPQVGVFREDALTWDWEINVINDETINAYVMPGGKMVIFTGLIDALKLNDDEIAAIVGHEMAHALREHSREKISQELAKSTAIAIGGALLGLSKTAQDTVSAASNLMLSLPYSRSMEIEADTMGMELMARGGYNPMFAVIVWEKMKALESRSGSFEFLSTHPADDTRIANLKTHLPTVTPLYEEAKTQTLPRTAAKTAPKTAPKTSSKTSSKKSLRRASKR